MCVAGALRLLVRRCCVSLIPATGLVPVPATTASLPGRIASPRGVRPS